MSETNPTNAGNPMPRYAPDPNYPPCFAAGHDDRYCGHCEGMRDGVDWERGRQAARDLAITRAVLLHALRPLLTRWRDNVASIISQLSDNLLRAIIAQVDRGDQDGNALGVASGNQAIPAPIPSVQVTAAVSSPNASDVRRETENYRSSGESEAEPPQRKITRTAREISEAIKVSVLYRQGYQDGCREEHARAVAVIKRLKFGNSWNDGKPCWCSDANLGRNEHEPACLAARAYCEEKG